MREQDFRKYLRKNPGPEIPELVSYRHAVVIPACCENDTLPEVLHSLESAVHTEKTATIVIVNHPASYGKKESVELLKYLQKANHPDVFSLYTPDITGGVGEARKTGMDLFLRSRSWNNLETSLIFSLDGDSPVAESYFQETLQTLKAVPSSPGIIIKIRHSTADTPEQEKAIREYERYLFRYAKKLEEAGSPYGFVSIGSGFAVRTSSYIKAGGMRIRHAGEDFYFLQELAKQAPLIRTENPLVFPSPRISERVPFGTGRSVKDLLAGGKTNDIPDAAFDYLKEVLSEARDPNGFLSKAEISAIPGDPFNFFSKEKFPTVWRSVFANTPADHPARLNAFHRWFDGLKTLRFLHTIQRNGQ